MRKGLEFACAFGVGGVTYALLEILWRGYTHWSMVLAGGAALVMLYQLEMRYSGMPLVLRCLAGAIGITAVELAVGCVVNLWWDLGVWDYSDMPGNLWGQICPAFSGMWFLLCIPAFRLCRQIRRLVIRWVPDDGAVPVLTPAHRQK